MVLVRILERKDASSLIVGIAAGLVAAQTVLALATSLVGWILDTDLDQFDFTADVLQPILVLVVSLALLEGLVRLVIAARGSMGNRS